MKGVVNNSHHILQAFQALTSLQIIDCESFRDVFTPTTTNFDLGALKDLNIKWCSSFGKRGKNMNEMVERGANTITPTQHQIVDLRRRYDNEAVVASAFPSHLIPNFDHIESLNILGDEAVEVLFEIESANENQQLLLFPHLRQLSLWSMNGMTHVWKKKKLLKGIPQQVYDVRSFHNLTSISVVDCNNIKYLLSPLIGKLLSNLKQVQIWDCNHMEEIITNRDHGDDDEMAASASIPIEIFPHLDTLVLHLLPSLNSIGGGLGGSGTQVHTFYFHRLTTLTLSMCDILGHLFTCSIIEKSLKQLKELKIEFCEGIQVIVKEEVIGEEIATSKDIVFPCLKSLKLMNLPNLKGFFLGMNDFQWPVLDQVVIKHCPKMIVFTSGHSSTPKLDYVHTKFGKHSLQGDLNFRTMTAVHEAHFSDTGRTEKLQFPWSLSNLVELYMTYEDKIVSSNELQQLQKVERLIAKWCDSAVEVFEVAEETSNDLNETQSVVTFPKLREIHLEGLTSLEFIWKNHKWTTLEFPNLTTLHIYDCFVLGHVFTLSIIGGLPRLQKLDIVQSKKMEVVFKESTEDVVDEAKTKGKEVVFPCLKSLTLQHLRYLKGFCLGNEAFTFPSLDTLKIKYCPQITVFTNGHSVTPKLKLIDTTFGLCYAKEGPNSAIKKKLQEGFKF